LAASSDLSAAAGLSAAGSASTLPGIAAMTVLSLAIEVTAGDFTPRGKVTADSFDPAEAGLAGSAGSASPEAEDLPVPPLSLPGDGHFGLVGRDVDRRLAEAAGGVEPDAEDLPEEDEPDEADRFLSSDSVVSVEPDEEPPDEEPRAAATVRSEDSPLPSGVLPFLLPASGLGSTLFRTTVSG
jgi:hypothetical protein